MIITSLDLEMNQPSGKIIQIGACVGNLVTGEILDTLRIYIKLDEPLNPFITTLTNITEQHLLDGVTLEEGYKALLEMHQKHKAYLNPLTWGGGDSECLGTQLGLSGDLATWCFGRRWLDVKSYYQFYCMANQIKPQSGLAKSLTKLKMQFKGTKHDALDDAINTFLLAHNLGTKHLLIKDKI